MTVTLSPYCDEAGRAALYHFFVAYFADLAQYDDNIVLNRYGLPVWKPFWDEQGGHGPTTVRECAQYNWWIRNACRQYLIYVDGVPAGFAIVLADKTHLPDDIDVELMDFYIAPKYRRLGVGENAARWIFDTQRGRWQVFQLERNLTARRFWLRVIAAYTSGHFVNCGEGCEQRFDNRLL